MDSNDENDHKESKIEMGGDEQNVEMAPLTA